MQCSTWMCFLTPKHPTPSREGTIIALHLHRRYVASLCHLLVLFSEPDCNINSCILSSKSQWNFLQFSILASLCHLLTSSSFPRPIVTGFSSSIVKQSHASYPLNPNELCSNSPCSSSPFRSTEYHFCAPLKELFSACCSRRKNHRISQNLSQPNHDMQQQSQNHKERFHSNELLCKFRILQYVWTNWVIFSKINC